MEAAPGEITQLLKAMHAGDSSAAEQLLPLVYSELHRLAESFMRRERPGHTLQTTALINEAYLRLAGCEIDWNSRSHFIGVAARVMRNVLVDFARSHSALRRSGGFRRIEMREDLAITFERLDELMWLDEGLTKLAEANPRQARVVELRYFGGLSFDQIARILDVSSRSVKRDWSLARIWLFRHLNPDHPVPKDRADSE
jgi:RNA polymerase sigma factor (TIGR02999 family)